MNYMRSENLSSIEISSEYLIYIKFLIVFYVHKWPNLIQDCVA